MAASSTAPITRAKICLRTSVHGSPWWVALYIMSSAITVSSVGSRCRMGARSPHTVPRALPRGKSIRPPTSGSALALVHRPRAGDRFGQREIEQPVEDAADDRRGGLRPVAPLLHDGHHHVLRGVRWGHGREPRVRLERVDLGGPGLGGHGDPAPWERQEGAAGRPFGPHYSHERA